ncbi:hypothetical protein AVDCRST_MAG84-5453 [uncultured Microcoleus sp.]|uniref:Uncharacterized protein n=1 Tax=uncultured Microcoleus sp. TaxID=259945 RepID=A0A6J4NI48_9CYAN|nr:hypothetical protein AVDCRST_MAG84-5453 [uncultured Microcoleus sp.]
MILDFISKIGVFKRQDCKHWPTIFKYICVHLRSSAVSQSIKK